MAGFTHVVIGDTVIVAATGLQAEPFGLGAFAPGEVVKPGVAAELAVMRPLSSFEYIFK